MRKITLHQALSELKTIDKRITDKISQTTLMGVCNESNKVFGNMGKEEFTTTVKAVYQSITDLIKLQTTLKKALMKANADTEVDMSGKKYKIIDIIVEKDNIKTKKELLAKMKQHYQYGIATMNQNNQVIEANLLKLLEAALGKDQTQVTSAQIEAVAGPYKKMNMFALVDPINIDAEIKRIEKEIEDFEINVDSTLSTINAITMIEID